MDKEVKMPAGRLRSQATRVRTRPQTVASTAMLVGLTGLVVVAVVGASAALALLASPYVAGVVLGAGLLGVVWALSNTSHRRAQPRGRVPGRSKTMDCRRARWAPRSTAVGQPHPPTEAQRRVRPCRGSRHL